MNHISIRRRVGIGPSDLSGPAGLGPDVAIRTPGGFVAAAALRVGDCVITARGPRTLVQVDHVSLPPTVAMIRFRHLVLAPGTREDVLVSATQRIVIKDWRALAIWRKPAVAPIAASLVDGEFVTLERGAVGCLVLLHVGAPEILLAAGLELASSDLVRRRFDAAAVSR